MSSKDQLIVSSVREDEMSIKEIILKIVIGVKYLKSKWLIILLFSIMGGGIGLFYAFSKKTSYTATSTFVIEDKSNSGGGALGQYAGLASSVGLDLGGSGGGIFEGENLFELYKSRNMIQKALLSKADNHSEKLVDIYIRINGLKEAWKKNKDLSRVSFDELDSKGLTRIQDSLLGNIVNDINKNYLIVKKAKEKLNLIKVDVKSDNELFSKTFNEQIVKTVNDFYVQSKTKKATENLQILQHQTDSVKRVLNGDISSSAAVLDATPNLNPTKQILRTVPVQKSQFSADVNKAILIQLVQNLELSKLSLRKETPLIQVIDSPVYPLSVERLGKLKAMVVGGFLFGFLISLFLIIKKVLTDILT